MLGFILRRLLASLFVLFGVSLLAFSMTHLVPGDPVSIMLGERATAAEVERLRKELGLDRPIYAQYLAYLTRALQGDLGHSIRSNQPVLAEIASRFGSTMQLSLVATLLAVLFGVGMGVIAAVARSPLVESLTMGIALLGLSMPTFWSGLLLILLFSLELRWLPVVGGGWRGLILPSLTLALPAAAVLARMTRSSLLEVLSQDYVRTARAKGLGEQIVVLKHALRNALIPILTLIGLQFGGLLAGAVIVESLFARPGVGRLAVGAILARDFPLVQGVVLLAGLVFVLVNLVMDLLYSAVDPRIQHR